MTTATPAQERAVYSPPAQYKLSGGGLLRSEWTKFWSLRSSWIVLVCAMAFAAGIGTAVAATYNGGAGGGDPLLSVDLTLFGVAMSSVFIAILGVLFITGEYTTGSIRSTMAAAPRRTGVLWAKAAVFSVIVLAVSTAMVLGTFVATQALLSGTDLGGTSITDPGVARVLTGYVASTVYLGLLGLAVGAILRVSAGAIAFYIGVIMILPNMATLLPWQWVADVSPYTPANVVNTLMATDTQGLPLTVGESWVWMGVWTVVSFAVAALLLKRRDV